jgi:hypothetical protein
MRCGSTGSGVYRKPLFINAIVLYGSRHLLVPSQVTGDGDIACPAQWNKYDPTACASPLAERDLCVGQYNTRLADVGNTSAPGAVRVPRKMERV